MVQNSNWDLIPYEVKTEIIDKLGDDIFFHPYRFVSKEFDKLTKDNSVWKEIVLRRFPNMLRSPYLGIEKLNWKQLYRGIYGKAVINLTTCLMLEIYKMLKKEERELIAIKQILVLPISTDECCRMMKMNFVEWFDRREEINKRIGFLQDACDLILSNVFFPNTPVLLLKSARWLGRNVNF